MAIEMTLNQGRLVQTLTGDTDTDSQKTTPTSDSDTRAINARHLESVALKTENWSHFFTYMHLKFLNYFA
jgi:hypothetical protein